MTKTDNNDTDWLDDYDDEFFQRLVDQRCVDNIRMLIVDAVQNVKAGHPGMALGMAEVGFILYGHVMKYNLETLNGLIKTGLF